MHEISVVITGVAGYLGGALAEKLSGLGAKITGVDSRPIPENISAYLQGALQGDVKSDAIWDRLAAGADVVFHLAAQTCFETAARDPRGDWRVNCGSVLSAIEAIGRGGRKPRFVHASSVGVCTPVSPLLSHKLLAEEYLQRASFPTTSLRLGDVYGESPGAECGFLNSICRRAARGEPLVVAEEGLRDYVALADVLEAFVKAATSEPNKVAGKSFDVCTGEGRRLPDVLRLVSSALGKEPRIQLTASQATCDRVGDPGAFTRATGWKPTADLATEIRALVTRAEKFRGSHGS